MLDELKNNMEKYDSDISVCDFYRIINNKKKEYNFIDKEFVVSSKDKFIHLENKYGILTVYAWNKLYKRKLFNSIRYPYGQIYEDSYIICNLLDKAVKYPILLNLYITMYIGKTVLLILSV